MTTINNNISCTNLDQLTEKIGGIIIPTKDKKYKRLKVELENEAEIPVGATLYVPFNSGTEIPHEGIDYTIVNVRDIIQILK
tara:strand:+ start:3047 stop:3292 length:246 start_codon:yes stop_codon:yes gene_type:complete